jgi:hypothetical protein
MLGKTFCGNVLVKSDGKKWETFLKYIVSLAGVSSCHYITIVHIILVKVDVLWFYANIAGDCVDNDAIPSFVYVFPIILLLLYIIEMFSSVQCFSISTSPKTQGKQQGRRYRGCNTPPPPNNSKWSKLVKMELIFA